MGVTTYRSGGAGVVTKCWESSSGTEAIKVSEKNTAVSIRHQQTQRQLVLAANQAHFGGAAHPAGMAPGAWGCGDNPRALVAEQVSSELAQHSTAQHSMSWCSAVLVSSFLAPSLFKMGKLGSVQL